MRFCLLASGSKGNAIWVEDGPEAILIDNGLSAKELKLRVSLAGLEISKLCAIFISHEHSDHLRGVGPLARNLKLPVFANQGTFAGAEANLGKVEKEIIKTGDHLNFGGMRLKTFPISHDANEPVGFVIESVQGALGLATDLGYVTRLVEDNLKGLRALILEFNHDYEMLMNGPYPWALKQRVRSRIGHLPNDEAALLAAKLWHSDLKHLVLAHLSETNNCPDKALSAAQENLADKIKADCAGQWVPTKIFDF